MNNKTKTFIKTLSTGDVFAFDGQTHTNVVVKRVSEPGRTSVEYTNEAGSFIFHGPGFMTVNV